MKIWITICLSLFAAAFADETTVTFSDGTVQGEVTPDGLARAFRGIPYATPPVNELRWEAPQPVAPWKSVKTVTTDGTACMQVCDLPSWACPPSMSEDCLYLNVFTPRSASMDKPLPVMLFFHGGNFYQGWGGGLLYDGRYIANQTSTILVTINYRLGAFGFLASPSMEGNYGLRDQILSMKWVQKNIAAFGGDPNQVTIFGQSAGSMSVAIHLYCPESQGLFHQAIMESEPLALPLRPKESMWDIENVMAKILNCTAGDVACMKSRSKEELLAAQVKTRTDILPDLNRPLELFIPFTPISGSYLVPEEPMQRLISGNFAKMPIIIGNTAQEGNLFVYEAFGKPVSTFEYDIMMDLIFGFLGGPEVSKRYVPAEGTKDTRPLLSIAATDGIFLCPNRNTTRFLSKYTDNKTWYYLFDHPPTDQKAWGNQTYCDHVSCHGSELPFVFHSFYPSIFTWTKEELQLSESIVDYWTNFAHTGDPNKVTGYNVRQKQLAEKTGSPAASPLLNWPPYNQQTSQNMHFQTPQNNVVTLFDNSNCTWWDSFGYVWP